MSPLNVIGKLHIWPYYYASDGVQKLQKKYLLLKKETKRMFVDRAIKANT